MTDTSGAQVWEVYHLWRTARLNNKYFCELLRRVQLESKLVEVVIAVAALARRPAIRQQVPERMPAVSRRLRSREQPRHFVRSYSRPLQRTLKGLEG